MSSDENNAVLQRIFQEIVTNGNLDLIDEMVTPDMVDHEEIPGVEATGSERLRQVVMIYRSAIPDMVIDVEDMIAEGDKVVARFTCRGTHQWDFMGIPATGKPFSISGIDIIRVADGRAVEHWGQTDNLGALQLGAIPVPEEPAAA